MTAKKELTGSNDGQTFTTTIQGVMRDKIGAASQADLETVANTAATNQGNIATNTSNIATINTTLSGYGDVVTHDDDEYVHKAGVETITGTKNFAAGGVFYGTPTIPTEIGRYILAYYSDVYGLRLAPYDGSLYYNLMIGSMPETGKFALEVRSNGTVKANYGLFIGGFTEAPAGGAGELYFNTTSNTLWYHDGTSWIQLGTNTAILTKQNTLNHYTKSYSRVAGQINSTFATEGALPFSYSGDTGAVYLASFDHVPTWFNFHVNNTLAAAGSTAQGVTNVTFRLASLASDGTTETTLDTKYVDFWVDSITAGSGAIFHPDYSYSGALNATTDQGLKLYVTVSGALVSAYWTDCTTKLDYLSEE